MREPQQIEIALVDRVEELRHPARHEPGKLREMPGHDNEKREQDPGRGNGQGSFRPNPFRVFWDLSNTAPSGEYEQELPAERIEIPVSRRKRRQAPVERARGDYQRLRQEAQEKMDKLMERIKELNQRLMGGK